LDWTPSLIAVKHAAKVLEDSPRWMGKSVTLAKNQLYWWECKRAEYIESNILNKFLAEYCSCPEEAFQHTTESVFSSEVLHELMQNAKPMIALAEIVPRTDLKARTA